ncbi:hypothetical protein [Clostridium sp. SM-530-WT-3G]|uniref:hypothetical protein n=1 Tax=Clostridium sp. SM-530-WT-3G TaxID=2725303 RepID=UPI00145D4C9A|nr:hypothetical protein [Clostridium sp. SM-530-WT-3G]NME83013.1 hypothetical protein [Clostridium sp. SM-530-WT-3G]
MTKNYNELSNEEKNKIVEYYYNNKNVSMDNISKEINISRRAVSRVLREKGINTRLKNRYLLNDNYFNEIDTEAKAYILGFIYADGFVGDEKYNNIVISINDYDILQWMAKEIEFTGTIRNTKKGGFENSKSGYSLNFSSKIMANRLREIGLYPNKSLTISELPKISNELMRHFVRGYFDGDGSILLSHNSSYYRNGNIVKKYIYPTYNFSILGTENFLKSIAKEANFNYAKIRDTKTKEIKSLNICAKKEFDNIFNYLYLNSTIKLERKYNKWNEIRSAFAEQSVKKMR